MLRLMDLSVLSLYRESTDSDYCQCLKVVVELVCWHAITMRYTRPTIARCALIETVHV